MAADDPNWRIVNRGLWDEMADLHVSTELYDLDGLVAGRDSLRPWEDPELGPVDGLDLVHLQCHIGTDTIGWARRGARVVGVDFSSRAIAAARDLSKRCGLEIEWVEADVYGAATELAGRSFDVVYTGVGALGWLPDLEPWAEVVRSLLRPGGVLYLVELHPMWMATIEDGRTIGQHAINAPFERWDEDGRVSYADPDHPLTHASSYERLHSISDVLSAVLAAGMVVELFHEFDVSPAPTPWLVQGEARLYRFAPDAIRFPLSYSLRARRPVERPVRPEGAH
jgi:SAM-dependent methyltransferase